MRSPADLRRSFARSDVRTGVAFAGAITALLVVLLGVLYFIAAHEAAEQIEDALEHELVEAASQLAAGRTPTRLVRSSTAVRLIDADGSVRVLYGKWPTRGRLMRDGTSTVRLVFAAPHDYWFEELALLRGGQLEGVASLAEFNDERREQLGQLSVGLAIGLVGVALVTIYATRLALRPLRTTTLALEHIDERNLRARIPSRGTGDDVDRHAAALNRVLARLEASFARMEAFSADVAHELRTPVNRILNLTDVALLRDRPDEAVHALEAVRGAAEEMRRLIEDMLLLARGEEGTLPVRPTPLQISSVVSDLADLYRPSCEEREVVLSLLEREDPGTLSTDPQLLQRAVSNLIDNAVRHTPAGGRIEIQLQRRGERASIAVSDSGKGIPETERTRVFDRFVQLDPARSSGGAGLGLPIARMIARLLGGDLTVANSSLGGACFELTLPAPRGAALDAASSG